MYFFLDLEVRFRERRKRSGNKSKYQERIFFYTTKRILVYANSPPFLCSFPGPRTMIKIPLLRSSPSHCSFAKTCMTDLLRHANSAPLPILKSAFFSCPTHGQITTGSLYYFRAEYNTDMRPPSDAKIEELLYHSSPSLRQTLSMVREAVQKVAEACSGERESGP